MNEWTSTEKRWEKRIEKMLKTKEEEEKDRYKYVKRKKGWRKKEGKEE